MLTQRPPFPSGVMDCVLPQTDDLGGVFLSGVEAATNYNLLQNNQIKAILTVGTELVNLQFQCIHKVIMLHDLHHEQIKKYFDESRAFIDESRKVGNVLVHCFVGVSRSATIVIAYLMLTCNYTLTQAMNYIMQARPLINPNPGFLRQLQQLDQELLRRRLTIRIIREKEQPQQRGRPPSADGRRTPQQSHRNSTVSATPLKRVTGPHHINQSPSSFRKLEGTPIGRQSLNPELFREAMVLKPSNYYSAKKPNEFMMQAKNFCKTFSATSPFGILLKQTPGQGYPRRFKQ
ncbi:hypothetical protein pb186bvf_016669 [Paramecium bursaria]